MRIHLRSRAFLGLAASALLLALGACSADSPTAPQQAAPPPTGGGGTPSSSWSITLQSSRAQLEVDTTRSAVLTVRVRDAVTNALPPEGAVITVSTNLGEFGTAASGATSILLSLQQGFAQVALFPGDEAGTAIVTARLEQSFGQISVPIVEPAVPTDTPVPDTFFLERVEPDEGKPEGGEIVRILGQEIESPVRVFFGGLPAEVLGVTSDAIRVRTPRNDNVPPAGRLPVDVEVTINTNEADEASDTLLSGFVYTREPDGGSFQPVIFSVTPNVGPNEGGTRVTINGDGFQSPVQVLFAGPVSLEAQVESVSRTQIVVRSPAATGFGSANQNQPVAITVRNLSNGLSASTAGDAFRYGVLFAIFAIDPSTGPYTGGTRVTIFGEGFDEPLVVDFDTVRQQVLSVTGSQILVRTAPLRVGGNCVDQPRPVLVTHLETRQTASGPSFTYLIEQFSPDVISTTPATLSQSPGNVTINGVNFSQPLTVTFNGRPVIVSSVTDSQIVGQFPDIPSGDLDENDCNDNGDSRIGQRFVITPFELVVTDVETGCEDLLSVNVRPNDQTCRNDIEPTPTPLPPTPTPLPPTPTPTSTPTP